MCAPIEDNKERQSLPGFRYVIWDKDMCGFSGFFGTGEYDREQVVRAMSEKIIHRGPDSDGIFVDDHVGLGFRRLSIIDLENGVQPMHSADGRYVIVFNGEIYNFKEIRKKLIREHGAVFQTNSDTEAILQAYMVYKERTASLLRGMFAFVIYDKQEHTMYGARDAFGIKPFYYAKMLDTLLFGSEIKSFLPHPAFRKEVNKEALKMYLIFQYSPMKETIFRNVYKLEPGTYFTYDGKSFRTEQYFNASFRPEEYTEDDAAAKIKKEVETSVKYHLIADVEVGSFLSGGVDSSFIATLARPDKTYSVGFKTDGFDESTDAKALCDILKIKNKRLASVISGALPAGVLGVGEPLIYGVTLPMGKPFITAGLGAGFGGAFVMAMQVAATTWGPSGVLGCFVMTAGPNGGVMSVLYYAIGLVISIIAAFLITNAVVKEEDVASA